MLALLLLAFQTTPTRYILPTPPPCGMPFHDASIVQRVNPQAPAGVWFDQSMHGTAEVDIAPDGSVMRVRVTRSTGDPALDNAMIEAARRSTYAAKQDNCTPLAGSYLYQADFGAPESMTPAAGSSAAPAASPAAATECNHEGRISTAAHVVYPASLRVAQKAIAVVRVTIGSSGELVEEKIEQSTGNDTLDQSALDAAKHSIYAPKVVDCKPVVAVYTFRVVFQPH